MKGAGTRAEDVFAASENSMAVVIIPFNYEQLPEPQRQVIVPICIASVDRHGNPIAPVWLAKGVVPIQDQLRNIARFTLGDVQRVSELVEITVHKLWERHGEDAGIWPWRRVLVRAAWEARDLAAGNSRWHITHTVSLAVDLLAGDLCGKCAADPTRYDEIYHNRLLLDGVERRIEEDGRHEGSTGGLPDVARRLHLGRGRGAAR